MEILSCLRNSFEKRRFSTSGTSLFCFSDAFLQRTVNLSNVVMIYEQIKQNAASIATISETAGENYSVLSEMNNLVLTCSEYLQRIVTNTNVLPNMNRMVEKIKINTDKL